MSDILTDEQVREIEAQQERLAEIGDYPYGDSINALLASHKALQARVAAAESVLWDCINSMDDTPDGVSSDPYFEHYARQALTKWRESRNAADQQDENVRAVKQVARMQI